MEIRVPAAGELVADATRALDADAVRPLAESLTLVIAALDGPETVLARPSTVAGDA